eukprot:6444672-Pyramimonas_sp.AAC.1
MYSRRYLDSSRRILDSSRATFCSSALPSAPFSRPLPSIALYKEPPPMKATPLVNVGLKGDRPGGVHNMGVA